MFVTEELSKYILLSELSEFRTKIPRFYITIAY